MDDGQPTEPPDGPEPNRAQMTPERTAGWHELLLALSGRIADDVVSAARAVPAGTDDVTRAREVVAGVRRAGAQMSIDDLLALVQALVQVAEPGDAETVAKMLDARGDLPLLPYRFSPLRPHAAHWEPADDGVGADPDAGAAGLDLSLDDRREWAEQVVITAVSVAESEAAVLGLWGAWRHRPETDPAGGVRVFLVETAADAAQAQVANRFQQGLTGIGETDSLVEVFGPQTRLAPYQRAILAAGSLLWTPHPGQEPQLVPVFDGVDPDGTPRFDSDHRRLDSAERVRVAEYLYGADALMITTARMIDVVDPQQGDVVPLSFRTDGRFIWPEAAAYFVDRYGLAPHLSLLEAIRSAAYRPPAVDGVTLYRAENALFSGAED